MQQIMCLSFLICEKLDNLKVTTPEMIKYRDDLIGFCEKLSAEVADTNAIQKSTYFWQIGKQIDTIMRRNFQDI
jgi:hypothetical protein